MGFRKRMIRKTSPKQGHHVRYYNHTSYELVFITCLPCVRHLYFTHVNLFNTILFYKNRIILFYSLFCCHLTYRRHLCMPVIIDGCNFSLLLEVSFRYRNDFIVGRLGYFHLFYCFKGESNEHS